MHLVQLRDDYESFLESDTEIISIGPDGRETFRDFWERREIKFIGLPDPELQVLNQYGQEVKLLKMGRLPAMVLVDKAGMIRWTHYGNSMSDIPSTNEMLKIIKQITVH